MRRLSPQEAQAVALLASGKSREDIEFEMNVNPSHLTTLLSAARRKGYDVPRARSVPRRGPSAPKASTNRLVDLVAVLGSKKAAGERVGLTRQAVYQRLKRAA